jgi:hypothetical protein
MAKNFLSFLREAPEGLTLVHLAVQIFLCFR